MRVSARACVCVRLRARARVFEYSGLCKDGTLGNTVTQAR